MLHSKSNLCPPATRALLLTTYVKWLNLFPEIREPLLITFRRYRYVLDAELQQRACEYLAIAERQDDEQLLQVICDEMPPFPERESALLSRLLKKHDDASDKRTWNIGGRDVNKQKDEERYKGLGRRKALPTDGGVNGLNGASADTPAATENVVDSLAGLNFSTPSPGGAAQLTLAGQPQQSTSPTEGQTPNETTPLAPTPALATSPAPPANQRNFTHGAEKWLSRLTFTNDGVLFEDAQLQIGLKSEYHGQFGRIALYFGNKISAEFSSFTVTIDSPDPDALAITLPKIPTSTLGGMMQVQQLVQMECKDMFSEPPVLNISYLAGSHQTLTLRLPVQLTKFIEPVKLAQADFFERWKQIGGPPREAQKIFPLKLDASGGVDTARHRQVIAGSRIAIIDGIDPNPHNIVGAGVLHMSTTGKVGCLLRLEPNADAKVRVSNSLSCGQSIYFFLWPALSVDDQEYERGRFESAVGDVFSVFGGPTIMSLAPPAVLPLFFVTP
jgi:AP-2 complex subunit alpha